ncbi:hypothetical protein [Pseudomonas sp. G2-4]|nr:hypothetical protein [Pseudomonas sp. G2-4]WHS57680.1 hypothetical protein QNH97_14425 [Pseudomonas sp. G2-4]
MTVREKSTLKSLQSKWAQGTATKVQVLRCIELEQKARAAARS